MMEPHAYVNLWIGEPGSDGRCYGCGQQLSDPVHTGPDPRPLYPCGVCPLSMDFCRCPIYTEEILQRYYNEWVESGFARPRLRRLHKAIAEFIRGTGGWCPCCTYQFCVCGEEK